MKTVLTIAGSDSSGGAGIQADLKTIAAHKLYGMSVITALTAQNTTGVTAILNADADFVAAQLDAVFTDIFPDAVKIGMVSNAAILHVIAEKLRQYRPTHIVVDPVMVATSGSALLQSSAAQALCAELIPLASLITPNIPEAEALSGEPIADAADMERIGRLLAEKHGVNVLMKGGHRVADANDCLIKQDGAVIWFCGERIDNPNTHGTGCTLSSAIACGLAEGKSLEESISAAKAYLTCLLKAGLDLGKGSGPLDHMAIWKEES